MNLEEIESNLPYGFHDSILVDTSIHFFTKELHIKINICIGDAEPEDENDIYRLAELKLTDLIYFIIDPSENIAQIQELGGLMCDGGASYVQIKTAIDLPKNIPIDAFRYWFLIYEWNSLIHVSAINASLKWI